jgi:ABC-2 type transport system permease protein
MNVSVVLTFLRYEIKRSLARKKVLALVAFTVLIDTVPYYALATTGTSLVPANYFPYLWVAGVFLPQSLFIQFTAILIAAGAMSEEYEQGTAELLLSKPVSRTEYFVGKFVGGLTLLFSILGVNIILSIISSYITFGPQVGLETLPGIYVTQAYASLVFFSIAFMLGELIRRSSLSYIFASAFFFSSLIIGFYMQLIYSITNEPIYNLVDIFLPNSAVSSFPLQYATVVLPANVQAVLDFVGSSTIVEPSMTFSAILILTYSLVGIVVSSLYFRYADISRRIA